MTFMGHEERVRPRRPEDRSRNVNGQQVVRKFSDFDLAAEFDDAVRRDAEELGGVEREIVQQDEQPVAPAPEAGAAPLRALFLTADKERGFHQIDAEVLYPRLRQRPHDVRLVEIAVAHPHRIEALTDFGDFEAPLAAYMWHVDDLD